MLRLCLLHGQILCPLFETEPKQPEMPCISVLFLQPENINAFENADMITKAMPSIDMWTQALQKATLPVLQETVAEVAELQEVEEQTGQLDANTVSQGISNDPLMVLKLLAHVSRMCTRRNAAPPETTTGALIMLGMGPFLRDFNAASLVSVQTHLHEHPEALVWLDRVIRRGRRAAMFAINFAMHRQDEDVMVVHEAALLHDAGELLLWCNAPALMLKVAELLQGDHKLRMGQVQQQVLGIESIDLSQEMMRSWQLSPLLRRCIDDRHAEHPQVRNVMLAVQLARHTQDGWDSPKAQATRAADLLGIAELLNISVEAAERKMRELDE